LFPLVPLLFLLATLAAGAFRRRVAMVWGLLAIVLGAYVIVLGWGPKLDTSSGLMVQVAAQKVVAISAVLALFFLTLEAGRLSAPTKTDADRHPTAAKAS
jgi:hypothetical protein